MIKLSLVLLLALQDKPLKAYSGGCQGSSSKIQSKELIRVTTREDWEKLWQRHTGDSKAAPPRVNFDEEMVVAVFFGACGWSRNGHETGVSFGSGKTGDKETEIILKLQCTPARYACRDAFPFWIGVFPKHARPIRVLSRLDFEKNPSGGPESEPIEVGSIK